MRSSVVFPLPFRPMIAVMRPGSDLRDADVRTRSRQNVLPNDSARSIGAFNSPSGPSDREVGRQSTDPCRRQLQSRRDCGRHYDQRST